MIENEIDIGTNFTANIIDWIFFVMVGCDDGFKEI